LSHHLASHRGWRAWIRETLEESPSWLVSLILHLVGFLIVTSVAVPWNSSGGTGSGAISLTVGFAERTESSQGPQVTVEPSEAVEETSDAEGPRVAGPQALSEDRAAAPPASARGADGQAATSAASSSLASDTPNEASLTLVAHAESYRVSPYAALLNRRRLTVGTVSSQVQTLRPMSEPVLDPQQRALDQVVDDFIAYDVGQLRGAAGLQARERFAELGPESIPALVRGLNRAAGIHASCPVGVIAGKLITTLRSANDPSLRQYAIDHIGVGVPEEAPHFHRLLALRKNWLGAPSMSPNVALVVDRLESRQEGELMELMLALSDAPSDTVVAALRSGDEYLAAAATLAIIQGPHVWDTQQRGQLRAAVMHFQSTARNPQIRSLTVDAQRVLTR
jgi:hypothetical protein